MSGAKDTSATYFRLPNRHVVFYAGNISNFERSDV